MKAERRSDRIGFQRTVLPNGVRIVTERIPSVRSISIGIWVGAGSRDEPEALGGISHFIEHAVFKGTQKRRGHQIAQRMEAVGGYLNAFTSKEYTCYYARALDSHLERALDVVCDLALTPTFPEREIEKEKDVILEEIRMYEDAPEDYIFDVFESVIYRDHALGRPILGTPETIRTFDRTDLLSYMDQHYTPDRTVIAVAGNVRHEKVVQLVRRIFSSSERTNKTFIRTPLNGYQAAKRHLTRPIQQAHLVLGTRCYDVYHPKRLALLLLNTILGGGMSSLLNQNIREKYGYCYNIYSFVNLQEDSGDFGVYMGTDPSKVQRSIKLIFREFDRLLQKPIGQRIFARSKNQIKGSMMLGLESMSNRMMRLGRQELYYRKNFTLDEIIETIDALSPEEIRAVAEDLLQPSAFSQVILLPD